MMKILVTNMHFYITLTTDELMTAQ